ncbi:hypothetical protein KC343_g2794 [Hortaea werneckii]|nr:hypothetical protein KC352_g9184 [Hortaea werneckii]KAI7572635.1 hypothetical protein KC317_g580 [Hortaea werneckii]KAI7627730.1 hypothetical protein KC346_g597 [Hortaea werneckii]KAI7633690.1 hypothetical protein KC343_g2794 [Hortaea werneckii]KAI7683309.1 hypothetical protein KC319_g526 [Hortaea werneckii]
MAGQNTMLNTSFPVLLPAMPELHLSKNDFQAFLRSTQQRPNAKVPTDVSGEIELPDSTDSVPFDMAKQDKSAFMDSLVDKAVPSFDQHDGKMRTENDDVAYRDSGSALVDAFFELEDVISGRRLRTVLEEAWAEDPDATLRIIWNARSIHLGKASRNSFYRAMGWLAENHPVTLLVNLPWLVRPLIQKKAPKPAENANEGMAADGKAELVVGDAKLTEEDGDASSDFEMVDDKSEGEHKIEDDASLSEFDVKYGVAHGYWKDLLNLLVLAANDQLKFDGDPRSVLDVMRPQSKPHQRDWTEGKKKATIADRYERVVKKIVHDSFYKTLHMTVARLFADQLKLDLARFNTDNKAQIKRITLCGKWAPSLKGMHDQHTFITSTIAELLFPHLISSSDREAALKMARQQYQLNVLSPLRKTLEIVEQPITGEDFGSIKYERVPSLAMKQYTNLFAKKDSDHFDAYIENVAQGKVRISGATLLPSNLVASVTGHAFAGHASRKGVSAKLEEKIHQMRVKSLDGQWQTLVQRIKDSGSLESAIAVCDVSGSMAGPRFPDGSCPMDSSIGLSLLLAEITKPPFGGAFITFSAEPQVVRVGGPDDRRSFKEKVDYIQRSSWSMNTDFVSVFEELILPMAIENKLKQEDMVKQVFVFSDMQFDAARGAEMFYPQAEKPRDWHTSYERIKKKFEEAGYAMPKLIFWNLAGGRGGYEESSDGDETAPKPVTASEEGTALVSGYSQGQMKMFLDNGQFEDPEDEVTEMENEDGEVVVAKVKAKQDPIATVRKAISHPAYRMLKVVD